MTYRTAGALREAVAFDPPAWTDDGAGGHVRDWDLTGTYECRAGIQYLHGGEAVQAARLTGTQPVVATIRANSKSRLIDSTWRMRDTRRALSYDIKSVVPARDRGWLEITAESGGQA